MVHNGIPLAKVDNVTSVSSLVLSDGSNSVPATFEVLARWGGAKTDTTKPIKWVLTSFPASVSANSTVTYYLRDYGTPATITNAISVTDGASSITVDTGPAEFVISETSMTLFDSITINGNALASSNGGSHSTISGQSSSSANAPMVTIERQNEQYVCIKSVGTYANTAVGTANPEPIHYRIRYEFFAGSPTVIISHKFFWPGDDVEVRNGSSEITVDAVDLVLPDMTGYSSTDVYATSSDYYTGITGETSIVSQDRRALFADAHQATVSHGATSQSTTFATSPAIINSATNGKLVATIGNMQFFEPQSIESDSSGKITINDMNDSHYFEALQGAYARIGIGAVSSSATYSDIEAQVIAPVDHRLMAIPAASYFATTGVVGFTPDPDSSDTSIQAWWLELGQLAATTETWDQAQGFQGLMTWGAAVRYSSEVGSATTWDKIFSGGTLTDYHNTWKQMTIYGLLADDPDKLSDYAFAGARRMLNTQIMQADDYSSPSSTYMGWAPAGYEKYRSDFNSSHSYFENLYLYYYLTGDMEVVDLLTVGANTRDGWYTRDGSNNLVAMDTRPVSWIDYHSRVFYQAATVFDFLGHASESRFLDDWVYMYHHSATSCVVMLDDEGTEEGFFISYGDSSPTGTGQSWMESLYTLDGFYKLWIEYGDLQLGTSNLEISRIYEAMARGFLDYYRTVNNYSDTEWSNDQIANTIKITYTGNTIGGTLTNVEVYEPTAPYLYLDGKSNMMTACVRAGVMAGDDTIKQEGLDGLAWMAEETNTFPGYGDDPLGKVAGIAFARLQDGLSYLDGGILPPQRLSIP